jgi:hypothetical protein
VTNRQYQHYNLFIHDITNDSVIPDAVPPESGIGSLQGFSEIAGVFTSFYSVVQPVENAPLNTPIEFSQLPFGKVTDFNRPGQDLLSVASVIYFPSSLTGPVLPVAGLHYPLNIAVSLPV